MSQAANPAVPGVSPTAWLGALFDKYFHPLWWIFIGLCVLLTIVIVPLWVTIGANLEGNFGKVWLTLFYSTIADVVVAIFVGFLVLLLGFIRGQPGGTQGFSINDGVNMAYAWLKGYSKIMAATLLGKQFAIFLLAFPLFALKGNAGFAVPVIALVPVVIIGALYLTTKRVFIDWIWYAYIATQVVCLVLWATFNWSPELRQTQEEAAVEQALAQAKAKAQQQNVAKYKKEAMPIIAKLEADTPENAGKSFDERVAALPEKDRELLRKADPGLWGKLLDKLPSAPALPASSMAPSTPAVPPFSRTVDFRIESLKGGTVCDLPNRTLIFRVPNPVEVFIGGTNVELTSYVRINGERSGEKFTPTGGCVQVTFPFNPAAYEQPLVPQRFAITFTGA